MELPGVLRLALTLLDRTRVTVELVIVLAEMDTLAEVMML